MLCGLAFFGLAWVLQLAVLFRANAAGVAFETAARSVSTDPVTLGAAQAGVLGAVLLLGLRRYRPGTPPGEALWIRPVPLRVLGVSLVGGLALQLPLAEIANWVYEVRPISLEQQLLQRELVNPTGWAGGVAAVVAFVVIAPVSEELLFRGLLLPGLAQRHGRAVAIGVTAVAFGLLHSGTLAAVLYATVAGILLGLLTAKTRSVLPAITLHAGNNAVPLLLPERLVRIEGLNTVGEQVYHLDLTWVLLGAAVTAACVGWVLWWSRRAMERTQ